MALDRQSIEKKDFPIGRRGYEPEAVDAHLSSLAAEVDQLRSSSARRPDNLATVASDQIRSIIEAAEQTAAEIERQAEADARDVRHEADEEARKIRGDASAQAKEHVESVSGASSGLQERIDAMERELTELLSTLRTGANRVSADLGVLQENMGVLRAAAGVAGSGSGEGASPVVDTRADEPEEDASVGTAGAVAAPPAETAPAEEPATAAPAQADGQAGASDDVEGARLVALNMALNGSSRQETEAYLEEHYSLPDRAGLLEEVYATVDG